MVVAIGGVAVELYYCDSIVSFFFDGRHGGADGEAVGHIAEEITHDATVMHNFIDIKVVGQGEGGGTDAAAYTAAITVAHHAAVFLCIVSYGMDADISTHGAVLQCRVHDISRDAANTFFTSDAGIGQSDVLDGGFICFAEETLVAVGVVIGAALIDADIADGMVLSVEGSLKIGGSVADCGEVVLGAGGVVPVVVVREGNICHL